MYISEFQFIVFASKNDFSPTSNKDIFLYFLQLKKIFLDDYNHSCISRQTFRSITTRSSHMPRSHLAARLVSQTSQELGQGGKRRASVFTYRSNCVLKGAKFSLSNPHLLKPELTLKKNNNISLCKKRPKGPFNGGA